MAKLSDRELLAAIENEERQAYGYYNGELAQERTEAMDYYLGNPFGNEVDGRSQVVSRDVADTIEWIMPSIMRVFFSGDKIVEFDPTGPEDVDGADQETDYVNYVVLQKNDAYTTWYTWAKDALLQKVGYVKACWETSTDVKTETYEGLSDEELTLLLSDDEVEPVEHTHRLETDTIIDPMTGQPTQKVENYHDVKVQRTKEMEECRVYPVPPEEVLVSTSTTSIHLKDARFIQHRPRKTLSEIRQMGYDVADDIGTIDTPDSQEDVVRNRFQETISDHENPDPSMRVVTFKETHIRIDYDGDGIAELRRVVHIGKEILANEEAEYINLSAWSPILMSHRHVGLSYHDLIKDLQLIKSTLLRGTLDNMYLANNGRNAVDEDRVNLDDLLTSRPGGIIRTKGDPAGAIMPIQHPLLGPIMFDMLEYVDSVREGRTGVTRYNQGLDANSLNKTASGISQIMSAAKDRIELVVRTMAETGCKDLFFLVHQILQKHAKKEAMFKLRNKWVVVDPRQWFKRTDMTVSVGLGTGNKDQMLGHLVTIYQLQKDALQIGVATPNNIYNTLKRIPENAGFKSGDEFFTEPSQMPQQQQGPDPRMMEMQANMQAKMADIQGSNQARMAEVQSKHQARMADMQGKQQANMANIQGNMQLKEQEMMMNAYLKDQAMRMVPQSE